MTHDASIHAGPSSHIADITGRIPLQGRHHIATWVFPPRNAQGEVPVLFCFPGGGYDKAYWHLEVPGHPGYSFAEHLAGQGMLVVAVDHLGVGESSRHPRAVELSPEVVSAANAAAVSQIVGSARDGSLVEGLGPLELGPVVGIGHSMGAMLTIFQQSLHGGFDAIAPLGYGTVGPFARLQQIGAPSRESIMTLARSGAFDTPVITDRHRPGMRHHFYWDDVPAEVIEADDLTATHLPGISGPLSIVPFIATDHAGRITCPVFIGLGERDSTTGHHEEPRSFYSARDITLFVLERSAHCHNTAGSRHALWNRIGRWVRALDRG